MGSLSALGVVETAYLTATSLFPQVALLCVDSTTCNSVLKSVYAYLPGTDIPLAALGCAAYATVLALSVGPLVWEVEDDTENRIALTVVTTTMGLFSLFLVTLLSTVLKASWCAYCITSAILSIGLATAAWSSGCIPTVEDDEQEQTPPTTSRGIFMTSGLAASVAAIALTVSGGAPPAMAELQSPPPITTDSSAQAMALARDLHSLDASFYGAFWCSHCYDQKQQLGKEAMSLIPYIECSREGENAQTKLCKSKDIPGYPTWEINGELYPGEQSIEELREIVQKAKP